MAVLTTVAAKLARSLAGYEQTDTGYGEVASARSNFLSGFPHAALTLQWGGWLPDIPTMPSGVTSFLLDRLTLHDSHNAQAIFGEFIDFGSIDIATGTFTDGVAMPARTVLGNASYTIPSGWLLAFCETAIVGTVNPLTVTYTDQDGNTGKTTTAHAMTLNPVIDSIAPMVLNVADWGVTDVTAATRTGGTSGTIRFYGIIPIDVLPAWNTAFVEPQLPKLLCRRLSAGAKIGWILTNQTAGFGLATATYTGDT